MPFFWIRPALSTGLLIGRRFLSDELEGFLSGSGGQVLIGKAFFVS